MTENEALINRLTSLLVSSIEDRKALLDHVQRISVDCNNRIAAMNDMVSRMIDCCTNVIEASGIRVNEEMLVEQNNRLIDMILEEKKKNELLTETLVQC